MSQSPTTVFAPALLAWFDREGRKHLPWQQNPTPYRVWVSEIMLQQTQVSTVIPYYQRFMQRFSEIVDLAAAPLDEVLHLWTGLGYYARARNLHRAAQCILAEHGGDFPQRIEQVMALPGIGRSTAGAILSLSRAQRHPILDGNVKRVLTRYFGIEGFPGDRAVEQRLWELAEQCTPVGRVAAYTQAIMDLGATLCVRARPRCEACPVRHACVAKAQARQQALPSARPKKTRPQRRAHIVIAVNVRGELLLEQRPPAGIWGGLWTFPQFDAAEQLQQWLAQYRFTPGDSPLAEPIRHSFTHFDLALHPLVIAADPRQEVADDERYCWYDPARPARIGLAKPVTEWLNRRQLTLIPLTQDHVHG